MKDYRSTTCCARINNIYRKHKSALTRAKNSGDPDKVIAACDAAFVAFDTFAHGWPDDWRKWERAKEDAQLEKRLKQRDPIFG